MLCLVDAAISAFKRKQRRTLIANVAAFSAADALDGIAKREFEVLVGEAFRLQG